MEHNSYRCRWCGFGVWMPEASDDCPDRPLWHKGWSRLRALFA